jgi:hypothetical protein
MDVLVMLEEDAGPSPVLAHVNSVPSPRFAERPTRDVVTLYGVPNPESLALALAAAIEGQRANGEGIDTIRHLGIWPERGAIGDAAWRDATGQLMTRDLAIPFDVLLETSRQLLSECGTMIRRLIAGLSMPDWPEGMRRAINISFSPAFAVSAANGAKMDAMLDSFREAQGLTYEVEGD